MRIPEPKDLNEGACDNSKVEPKTPIVNVPKVVLNPLFHQVDFCCFSTEAIHLRPPGDAGLDVVPERISFD
jgi:hypothetical protein